jgi:hypothetical protein
MNTQDVRRTSQVTVYIPMIEEVNWKLMESMLNVNGKVSINSVGYISNALMVIRKE